MVVSCSYGLNCDAARPGAPSIYPGGMLSAQNSQKAQPDCGVHTKRSDGSSQKGLPVARTSSSASSRCLPKTDGPPHHTRTGGVVRLLGESEYGRYGPVRIVSLEVARR